MRLRNVKNANSILDKSSYVVKNPTDYQGNFNKLFNNSNPIHIEIGMGKGDFIINMAKEYPDINFVGVEKYESVLVRAVQKLEDKNIPNLYLLNVDAKELNNIFNHEIDTIYLNFSDPWPKTKHEKRRLTSNTFLPIYDEISIKDTHIIQKTDNKALFSYSIMNLSLNGYIFNKISLDLENDDIPNIKTEYEKKFSEKGESINYLDAVKYNK